MLARLSVGVSYARGRNREACGHPCQLIWAAGSVERTCKEDQVREVDLGAALILPPGHAPHKLRGTMVNCLYHPVLAEPCVRRFLRSDLRTDGPEFDDQFDSQIEGLTA